MARCLQLGLLLWALLLAPALVLAGTAARTVALRATITITNDGDRALAPYLFSLSIPVDDHAQQSLSRIDPPQGESYRLARHGNGVDSYMTFNWQVPAHSKLERQVGFVLRLQSYDYRNKPLPGGGGARGRTFLQPGHFIESDASEVTTIARAIQRQYATPEERLRAAYRYPQEHLRYRTMANRGALYGLRNGVGDCTEYAAIFVALARAMGYPARLTSEFLFTKRNSFPLPNHHAAEVWLDGQWLPVDANLALEPALGYGFGQGAVSKVVLKRDGSWTWAHETPGVPRSYRGKHLDVDIKWTIQVLD